VSTAVVVGSLVTLVTSVELWGLMLAAIPLGMIFGAVPGLGGRIGLVVSIPFVFGMDPVPGAVFLLALHSVVHTGGSIPSILLGIPSTGPDAATVCDGHPMTLRGEAGRALGASLAASAVGGVVGALFLAALLPVIRPTILAFGPPEFFFLALLGITFIGAISGESLSKGVLVGATGLMLSFIGTDAVTGTTRFTLGRPFLADGIGVVVAILAIFTIPETITLAAKGRSTPSRRVGSARYTIGELIEGVRDVGRHWGLTLRTSVLGAGVGLVPGLGGDVAAWTCYGHAVLSSKTPERFGKGAVEGVIAPEAANNSKEGGALLPTLFFGIPGSSGMAIMLGAFIMLGIQPGPALASEGLDLVWILIWTLVIANVLAAVLFLAIGRWLILVASLRPALLLPFVLLLTLLGAYLGMSSWQSLVVLLSLGIFGYGLKRSGWPRAPFAIGVVLGPLVEISLHQSLTIWGLAFIFRPIALGLALATLATVAVSVRRARARRRDSIHART
jgi:TctA family transporter